MKTKNPTLKRDKEIKNKIPNTRLSNPDLPVNEIADKPEDNAQNPRFYGLIPLIWFSVGIIFLMIMAKLILDWLAKS